MNPAIKMASGAQCATLAGMVSVELTKSLDGKMTFDQCQTAITDKEQVDVKKLAEKFANEIFGIPIDLDADEKRKISHFYKTCFKDKVWKNPNLDKLVVPEAGVNLHRLEFIYKNMTEDEALEAYAEYFGKDKVWKEWSDKLSEVIDYSSVQARPEVNYFMRHVGGDEPDMLNKSYDDGIAEEITFMTPKEGIISAFRYRFETTKMYDVIGVTRLSALDRDGYAMCMYGGDDGEFGMDGSNRSNTNPQYGLRQVKVVSNPS